MELLQLSFFQHALCGALLVSLLCAFVGSLMVTRRAVIQAGGIAHASLGGVGLGAFLGSSPLLGATVFAVLSGWGVQWLGYRRNVRTDAVVAILWTFGMSVGIVFAYLTPGFATELPAFLFGDILSISAGALWFSAGLTLVTTLFFLLFRQSIVLTAYDRDFALTRGIPVILLESCLTLLTSLTIVAGLNVVGIVLIIALLSIPQSTAGLFVRTFGGMVAWSALFGAVCSVGGLLLAFYFDLPAGATIILLAIAVYLLALLFART
ncbi:MAG: metal ABC transporter permease [Alloprevotella sp.]